MTRLVSYRVCGQMLKRVQHDKIGKLSGMRADAETSSACQGAACHPELVSGFAQGEQ